MDLDFQVRTAAFTWLSEQVSLHGDVLPRALLVQGFEFHSERIPLVSPQGIFKPKIIDLPLSITTSPNSPYDDYLGRDDFLIYRYRGQDPDHRDNVGLRKAYLQKLPLVYFHGVEPGSYLATWPVYIVGDDQTHLSFKVSVDDQPAAFGYANECISKQPVGITEARRAYITSTVRIRIHQRVFREKVLNAYRCQCAFCRLKHRELLDAAHIIPDNFPEGKPGIENGISLCKLHHAAYDRFILGVTPDYVIQVRKDVLEEDDGPVLQHGLKELHNAKIILPASQGNWPSQAALEWRYRRFMNF
ncbi:MAG: HNH endonuclease [Anaerolineales bacterium]|nr:HNH endonuclease [Anaerolineales bacterium]